MTETPLRFADAFATPSEAQWRVLVDKLLNGAAFEKRLVARSDDGLAIQPLYARARTALPAAQVPAPGVRLGLGWDIRQVHADADPATANQAILDDLAGGATSIQLRIAAPGWSGLPYDGASIARTLDNVLLDVCPIALVAGEYTPDAAGSLMALWRQHGLAEGKRHGAFNYDPLGTLALTGALYHPIDRALAIAAGLANDTRTMPGVTALAANGHVWHRGGATEAQELAAVLASIVAYLRACERAGLTPAAALPKIAVTLAVDADQLMGLAKLRAARLLMARIADACGCADQAIPIAAETSERMLARRDPWVNLLRGTMACATAAMAGADSIVVLPFSWALGQPDAFARRIARNTHHVLIEEAGIARVNDPAAGSFAVEALTHELAAEAWTQFQAIEAEGGLGAALQSGSLQDRIGKAQDARERALALGRIELTGTSAFPRLDADGVTARAWPAVAPAELNGERARPLVVRRLAEPFERLRDAADAVVQRTGKRPRVFLAGLGDPSDFAARSGWVRNVLAAGGIAATFAAGDDESGFHDTAQLGSAFAASGLAVACLCTSDQVYAERGEAAAAVLKQAGASHVYVAGRPKAQEALLVAAGVDAFIDAGCHRIEVLTQLHAALGISG